jgi:hypothetical protein
MAAPDLARLGIEEAGQKWSSWFGALRELSLRSLPKSSPSFPTPADRLPLKESELDVDMSNWLNFRRLDIRG